MTDARDARRALLISGAISGELTPAEQTELDALRATDPTIDEEIRELSAVLDATTAALPRWDSSAPSEMLRDRVLAIATEQESGPAFGAAPTVSAPEAADTPTVATLSDRAARRRPWLVALGAAACVAVGAGGALVLQPSAPVGPPGTLGAIEQIAFTGEPTGVTIDGSLIAHTWGTETVLNITGLTQANPYEVVLVTVGGDSLDSGSFLGSTVDIDCEMNAAVMREDVASVEIQDASGVVVASAQLPPAR